MEAKRVRKAEKRAQGKNSDEDSDDSTGSSN